MNKNWDTFSYCFLLLQFWTQLEEKVRRLIKKIKGKIVIFEL